MKKLILFVSLLSICSVVYGQHLWSSDESVFAQHRYYASVGIGWATPGEVATSSVSLLSSDAS